MTGFYRRRSKYKNFIQQISARLVFQGLKPKKFKQILYVVGKNNRQITKTIRRA